MKNGVCWLLAAAFIGPPQLVFADDASPTVLITGANRGLGLVWAEKYADRGWNVIATARTPAKAVDLRDLGRRTGRVAIERLDVTDLESIDALGQRLDGKAIDVLINNIGMLGENVDQSFGELDPTAFNQFMWVNAFGALLVTERLWGNLQLGEHKKVAAISAGVASFDVYPRIHRGLYHYKASKVALNMIMRNVALEGEPLGIAVAVLSPGVVNTSGAARDPEQMSPEMRRAMVDIDTSVEGMIDVMNGLTLQGSGVWYRYNGEVISW